VNARIHPTAMIEDGCKIGNETAIWDHVHVRHDTRIGEQCIVGGRTIIAYGVSIGNRCKINSNVYICTAVTIEDGVMISAGVIFTNDRFPRAASPDLTTLRSSEPDESTESTLVCSGATIGAGAIIGSGLRIGRWAMIGMGAIVTKSIPDFHLAMGAPCRSVGVVCRCGRLLAMFSDSQGRDEDYTCAECGRQFHRSEQVIVERVSGC
jgi:UDP-2-acetamido-3-amino-2,3-dideoxy-glucuronate N-acetyltransferase